MAQLCDRWCRAGHELHLVTWAAVHTDHYKVPADVQRHGLDLMQESGGLLGGIGANLKRVRVLRRLLKQISPEFILSFSDQMNIVALEAARGVDCPIWISEHSNPEAQRLSRLWEAWRSRSYPTCTGCVVLTDGIADVMQRWVHPSRLVVIPPAVSPPRQADSSESARLDSRELSGAPSQNRRILSVGRLSIEKGQDLLLEAWRNVAAELPEWELQFAGDGPLREQLQQQAIVIPRVSWLGWIDNPWQVVSQADLFVLPSRYEGFPVAMLEAMSQGVCCIATQCCSAIETLNVAGAGLEVVPIEQPQLLGQAILKLAADADLRRKRGGLSAAVSQQYRWEVVGPKWDALLLSGDRQ